MLISTPELVVVQTYPAHFYQTLACLRNIRTLNSKCEIWLFADNFSNFSWDNYISYCHEVYRDLVNKIVPFSDIHVLYRLRNWPWLRQQTNKLLLDKVIDRTHWFFTDGDVQLRKWPAVDRVPGIILGAYQGVPLSERDPRPGEVSSQILFYIRHMLGGEFGGFWTKDDKPITASNPPVKIMQAEIIRGLRNLIESRFSKSLVDVHFDLRRDTRMAASEWDLIEAYRQTVLGQAPVWELDDNWYETTWSADRELGKDWFQSRGITINAEIWQLLPKTKNYL